jgi:pimeloyl-ACP methyl ester carboxylesterase
MTTDKPQHVVLLSGLWLPRWSLWLLALRLRRCGFVPHLFSYRTTGRDLQQNAASLQGFLRTLPAGTVHLVAFSLGGLVVRALFHFYPQQSPGRIVTLGTPHNGSLAAERMAQRRFSRVVAGKNLADLVAGQPQSWALPARELGIVAGSVNLGLGRLVARHTGVSDGTVALSETRLVEATDFLCVKTSHFGLLLSAATARAVCRFLRNGRFTA